jgi:hypothetical protein
LFLPEHPANTSGASSTPPFPENRPAALVKIRPNRATKQKIHLNTNKNLSPENPRRKLFQAPYIP